MPDSATDPASRAGRSWTSWLRRPWETEKWLLGALYVVEALAVALVLLAYRIEGKSSLNEFLSSRPGLLSLAAGAAFLAAIGFIAWQCWREIKSGSREWLLILVMNATVLVGIIALAEIAIRTLIVESNTQETIAGKLLYPRRWDVVRAKFQAILSRAREQPTFWVEDGELGWTIGPNRQSANGLYFSSTEGIRSSGLGISYGGTSSSCRIAVVGDSYAFGEEVRHEDSWAYLLGQDLGPQCQVLNFGVGGYGVDQMYLRYMREVRLWKPDVVVLSFINHDIIRTLSIYSFLVFSDGATPFAKPRFVFRGEDFLQLNAPLITVDEVFSKRSIRDLPFIEHDISYKETEWDRPAWRYAHHSYLFRLMMSLFPLYERERPEISEQKLKKVNLEFFKRFVETVETDGGKPLVVYLPTVEEVPDLLPWEPIGLKILREGGIPHINLRDCVAAGYHMQNFMPGGHYSPEGNRVAARCLLNPVRAKLQVPSKG